jgi:hypothetical protein
VRKELKAVLAVGLMSVAVALAARQIVAALAPPSVATLAAAPAPAAPGAGEVDATEEASDFELWEEPEGEDEGEAAQGVAKKDEATAELPGVAAEDREGEAREVAREGETAAAEGEGGGGEGAGEEDEPSGSASSVRMGGWERGAPLPLCGREGTVKLRSSPGGAAGPGSLASCEEQYGEFPQLSGMVAISAREGDWVKVPNGWASVDEVRTAEVLIVDGREFWHSLFKASVVEVKDRRVVLEGDADPCAGEVCGNAHGEWEQAEEIRRRYAAEHPGGVPPEASAQLQAELEAIGQASEAATKEAEARAAGRAKQRRVLELAAPPPVGGGAPRVEGGQYLCCT